MEQELLAGGSIGSLETTSTADNLVIDAVCHIVRDAFSGSSGILGDAERDLDACLGRADLAVNCLLNQVERARERLQKRADDQSDRP